MAEGGFDEVRNYLNEDLRWVHESVLIKRVVQADHVTKLVGGHKEEIITRVMAEAVFAVAVEVCGGGAPWLEVFATHYGAFVIRVAVVNKGKNARSTVAVAAVRTMSCKKTEIDVTIPRSQ